MNYFRITGYYPKKNICFIIDCYGRFEELYNFSEYISQKGIEVVKARKEGRFEYGDLPKAEYNPNDLILRACAKGQPIINGEQITVNNKSYIAKR